MPRMYRNRRRHHHTWPHWGRTWCLPMRYHENCPQIWLGVQPTEDTREGPSRQFLWMPLQCQWSPPRPRQGRCCTCLASTHQHHWTPGILRSSHIPKPLHPWSIHLDWPSMRAAQKGHRLQLEPYLWHHFWVGQGSCHQWHHPQVLGPITTHDNQSWCLTGRPWCSTPAEWQAHSLCQQGPHWNQMPIHKHWEREMLAAVFGAERFHTYVYGQLFTIESDHKPLESISRKNLADTPAQLQCMMLHLQGYDFTIRYCPGKEMVIPDILSRFSPRPGPDLPLDIAIHHARPQRSLPTSLCEWPRNASSSQPHHHRLARGHQGNPSSPPSILATPRNPHCQGWPSPARWSPHHSSCWKGENPASTAPIQPRNNKVTVARKWKFSLVWHQQGHQSSSPPVWNLHPIPESECCSTPHTCTTPSCPWQMCATDIFTLEGINHLVVGDFYLKMIFVWCLPPGQSNANKVISLLKEMFSEHGIPEVLCSDNGPQYVSAQFADFCISWDISHGTSSLHYLQSNGFAEACVKSAKHALQQAKYSGADPHLALLALRATPINSKLPSPAELLYQCWLRTTILAKICNSDL